MNYPVIFVIFGATGDLAERKLFPALFGLHSRGLLPARFKIVAFARRPFTDESFRELIRPALSGNAGGEDEKTLEDFLQKIVYHQGLFDEEKPYVALINRLGEIDKELGACSHKIFHLAVSPFFYETVLARMEASGLNLSCTDGTGETRVLVEKPIGTDLTSARRINSLLADVFQEDQVFRVDHYLAKNALYDLLTLHFSETLPTQLAHTLGQSIDSVWNGDAIASVRLFLYEKIAVEGRGSFYEKIGAVRDVGQNHLLEMLALLLADKAATEADRDKRIYRSRALAGLEGADIGVVGAGTAGKTGSTSSAAALTRAQYQGYRAEEGVAADSQIETYFRIPFAFRTGQWKGAAFALESGKALARAQAGVAITFRKPIAVPSVSTHEISALTMIIQPDPSIELIFADGKKKTIPYAALFSAAGNGNGPSQNASSKSLNAADNYERVYRDALLDDHSRFVSAGEVEASWTFIDRVLVALAKTPLTTYSIGTRPEEI